MNRLLFSVTAAAIFACSPAFAAEDAQTFVDKAANGGMFEVQSGELAVKKSKSAEVKKFAQMMVADHSEANKALKAIAQEEGLMLPASLDREHAAKIKTLQNADGQFDLPYVKAQLDGHQQTVQMFESYAESGDNAALKDFARKTLPTLKTHLSRIEEISGKVSSKQ